MIIFIEHYLSIIDQFIFIILLYDHLIITKHFLTYNLLKLITSFTYYARGYNYATYLRRSTFYSFRFR